jgi:hypothetical protein
LELTGLKVEWQNLGCVSLQRNVAGIRVAVELLNHGGCTMEVARCVR